jgi:hypothetical protein
MRHGRPRARETGSTFIEYTLLIGAVSIIVALALTIAGHKVGDISATASAIIPGAHSEDDVTFTTGELAEFSHDNGDAIWDTSRIGGADDNRLGDNLGIVLSNIVKGSGPPPPPPPTPQERIASLRDDVDALPGFSVWHWITRWILRNILNVAINRLDMGDPMGAILELNNFIFNVNTFMIPPWSTISPADGNNLINQAQSIIDDLP